MRLELDDASRSPLAEQIAAAIRRAIVTGELRPGDRLPSGRDLAESSGVTLETVQRGYRLLVDDGLVVARVGRGTSVAADVDPQRLSLQSQVDDLVVRARQFGMTAPDLSDLVIDRWNEPHSP